MDPITSNLTYFFLDNWALSTFSVVFLGFVLYLSLTFRSPQLEQKKRRPRRKNKNRRKAAAARKLAGTRLVKKGNAQQSTPLKKADKVVPKIPEVPQEDPGEDSASSDSTVDPTQESVLKEEEKVIPGSALQILKNEAALPRRMSGTFQEWEKSGSKVGHCEKLQPENDEGNIEYKLKLLDPSKERFEQLVSQMAFRLEEGKGEAIYEVGVEDDGTPTGLPAKDLDSSLHTLERMVEQLAAELTILRIRDGLTQGKLVAELQVRRLPSDQLFFEVRVACVGNVDSGKSTLLGVLSRGKLDNGRGLARTNVFTHVHEVTTGRTSDVSRQILGFNKDGNIVNYSVEGKEAVKAPTWMEIMEAASKVIMFMDLAGHERYLKTTVFGLTGNFPDYAMMVVGANMGIVGMSKEHYHLALALRVPVFVVVTKIDICPPNILQETMSALSKMLKAPGSKKLPLVISQADDVLVAIRNFESDRICPIFMVSNVTGESLGLLRLFLNLLPARKSWEEEADKPALMHIDSTFSVTGVGTVVSGTLTSGSVSLNETLSLGPNSLGQWKQVSIKSIHTNRLPSTSATAGQSVSLALKKVKRDTIKKGMVLVDDALKRACVEFEAEIFIISHSTTISFNYEAVIHCGCVRQVAQLQKVLEVTDSLTIDNRRRRRTAKRRQHFHESEENGTHQPVLRSGCKGRVLFRFKYYPVFITEGARLIFREGRTKGIGRVSKVFPYRSKEGDSKDGGMRY